ncbi:DUF89 family protein [bacterium]|nr:MAG: DUF89 family protein [bacterium]
MRARRDCLKCLLCLAEKASAEACADLPALLETVRAQTAEYVRIQFSEGESVPTRVATGFLRLSKELTGNPDPFRRFKEREFAMSAKALPLVAGKCGGDLEGRLKLAAMGNRLDYFRPFEEVEREWREFDFSFASLDLREFENALETARKILILADNSGEALFDLPLIEFFERAGFEVSYCVKGEPSQNDLTREGAERFGLHIENLVDTGSDCVGVEPPFSGEEFHAAWKNADVIVAKGMANLETLTEYPEFISKKPVFFLLCAKCDPVASWLGVERGSVVFVSGTGMVE